MISTRGLVVFDVDGTLIDSQNLIVASMSAAYGALGLEQPRPQAIRRIIGLSLLDAVARLSPGQGPQFHLVVARAYKDAFSTLRSQPEHDEPLFPGARAAMDHLIRDGWQLGVATGKSRRGLFNIIDRHGLDGYFVTLQTADDNPGKPHPAMLQRALAEADVAPDDSVMVGDTTFDMVMGRNAGVRSIGVAWGNHPPEDLLQNGADIVIEDFAALPEHVAARGDVLPACLERGNGLRVSVRNPG